MPATPGPKKLLFPELPVVPMYRSVLSDDFNRADTSTGAAGTNTGAGNGWVDVQGGVAQIAGNKLKITSDSAGTGIDQYKRDFTVRPVSEACLDQSIEFDIPAQVWNTAASFGPVLAFQTGSNNCYLARITGTGVNFQIFKIIGGTPTGLAGPVTLAGFSQSTNYRVRFSKEGTNLNFELTNKDTGQVVINLQVTDSSITAAGTQGICGPWDVAATSVQVDNALVSTSTTFKLGIIGDSISINIPPGGLKNPGSSLARELSTRCRRQFVLSNQAISGKTSGDWSGDVGSILTTAKAAFATAGVTDVSIMLGTNDAKVASPVSKATYKANMSTLANNLVAAGYRVFLHTPPYVTPGAFTTTWDVTAPALLQSYGVALTELHNGSTIICGDLKSYKYFERFQGLLTDLVHPTIDGGEGIASLWADAVAKYFV